MKSLLAKARQHMRTAYSSFQKSKFQEAIAEYHTAKSIYEQAQDDVGKVFVEYRLAHCYVLRADTRAERGSPSAGCSQSVKQINIAGSLRNVFTVWPMRTPIPVSIRKRLITAVRHWRGFRSTET